MEDVAAITHLDIAEAKHDVLVSIIVPLIVMVISAIILYILSTKPVEQFILKKPEKRLVNEIQFQYFQVTIFSSKETSNWKQVIEKKNLPSVKEDKFAKLVQR